MSGYPEKNFPAFHRAAKFLRDHGEYVLNPAEICAEDGHSWGYYMRKDIAAMIQCDAIYLLYGWENSKGAKLEKYLAEALGIAVHYQ